MPVGRGKGRDAFMVASTYTEVGVFMRRTKGVGYSSKAEGVRGGEHIRVRYKLKLCRS